MNAWIKITVEFSIEFGQFSYN